MKNKDIVLGKTYKIIGNSNYHAFNIGTKVVAKSFDTSEGAIACEGLDTYGGNNIWNVLPTELKVTYKSSMYKQY